MLPKRTGRPTALRVPATPPPTQPINKAAFARWLGCKPPMVSRWLQEGALHGDALADGLILAPIALAQLVGAGRVLRADPADALDATLAIAKGAAARGMSYDEARTATETLKAHHELLDLRERRGELVERRLAEGLLFSALREVRDAWLAWPNRVAATMAAALDVPPAALLGELDKAVRQQLADVADPKADWASRARRAVSTAA